MNRQPLRGAARRSFAPATALAAAMLLGACASSPTPVVEIPAAIAAPPHQRLAVRVGARGVQIYECKSAAPGNAPQWAFVAPDAELLDADGRKVGHHGAGPHWTFQDGTRITARVAARADAPQAGAIPWLLLESRTQPPASVPPSPFGDLRSIQRIHTTGGSAPAEGCGPEGVGSRVHVPYTADYLFYSGAR